MDPFEPFTSQVSAFLRPTQKRDASIVPMPPDANSIVELNASSTSTDPPGRSGTNVRVAPVTASTSPTR
jgi:hypothetical protein